MTTKAAESLDVPTADWVTIPDLYADPYPIYRTLRESAPIHWVPAVNRYLVIGYDACHTIELDPTRFSADETGSLMKRSMGHSMLRKDNPAHDTERRSLGGTLRPKAIKEHWNAAFARNAATYLGRLRDAGSGADLVEEFAAPFAAENLRAVLGLRNATQDDLQRWSQTLIDGTGNYADDPAVWAEAARSSNEVDSAIDEMLPVLRADPDASVLAQLAGTSMSVESMRANLKMAIGGGLNEPRDAIATTVWALLSHPLQRADVVANDRWSDAFEESIRWVAPISMYPREVTDDTELAGMTLPRGARLGVVIGAANRDPEVFVDPESYDIDRPKKPHLAFGGGQHFCAGAWVARASVVGVALPALFREFSELRLDPQHPETLGGWVFRGVTALPVQWS
ncbi:cytochrome P450 [Rhodococcus fascians]|uniref:cytochrome P450 n=1 Tax=Rhodococcoides fascians TaxID=1828 RepID=UPI00050C61A8|nr:cytochrome P450 [Rhodococcus fascians]MBY4274888.1 cytochrome P450 [Rhodococcus fascians]MBY4429704.1 cytochrome P450 [Rhodococcus fascians]